MRSFLERLSSRKFLTTLAVEIAAVVALFWPQNTSEINEAAIRIAALATLLLAALGYGKMEAALDAGQTSTPVDGQED